MAGDGVAVGAGAGAAAGSVIPGLGTAVGAGVGALVGGVADWFSTSAINAANARQGRLNRAFQAEQADKNRTFSQSQLNQQQAFTYNMSSTAYQRAMRDMRRAGLNPMLAYMQGGASTPSGGSPISPGLPSGSQVHLEKQTPGAAIQRAIATSLEFTRMRKEIEQANSNIRLNNAATEREKTQSALNEASTKISNAELPGRDAESQLRKAKADYAKDFVPFDKWKEEALDVVKGMAGVGGGIYLLDKFTKGRSNSAVNVNEGRKLKLKYSDDVLPNRRRGYKGEEDYE